MIRQVTTPSCPVQTMRAYNEGVRIYAMLWQALLVLSFIKRLSESAS